MTSKLAKGRYAFDEDNTSLKIPVGSKISGSLDGKRRLQEVHKPRLNGLGKESARIKGAGGAWDT